MKKDVGGVSGNILGTLVDSRHKLQYRKITPEKLRRHCLGENWQNFYRDIFGVEADFSNLRIPSEKEGFDRLIIVADGMTPQRLYGKCKELFPCWKQTGGLDKVVISSRAAKNRAYAIWIRDRVEADKELSYLSVDNLKEQNIPGITLEERLLYELKYFSETKQHLDMESITFCAGSRYNNGFVPTVKWASHYLGLGDELRVHACISSSTFSGLRSRVVVS